MNWCGRILLESQSEILDCGIRATIQYNILCVQIYITCIIKSSQFTREHKKLSQRVIGGG